MEASRVNVQDEHPAKRARHEEAAGKEGPPEAAGAGAGDQAGSEGKQDKWQKKKVALLLGYSGANYQGMQVNKGARTIEGELFQALSKAGGVSEANSIDQKKIHLMRAARTDKGVHAAGQVVSLKLVMKPGILEEINSFLPADIRLFAIRHVTKTFQAKNFCNARIYEYLIPTYLFQRTQYQRPEGVAAAAGATEGEKGPVDPPAPAPGPSAQDRAQQRQKGKRRAKKGEEEEEEEAESESEDDEQNPEEVTEVRDTPEAERARAEFRLSQQEFDRLQELLKVYVGTHNYHNFTSKKRHDEASSKRYIISFKADPPQIIDGLEWVSIKVKGQSFMLHQIRKMIGLAVAVMRTGGGEAVILSTFAPEKKHIPIAPGFGLLLNQICYDNYNDKQKREKREPLEFPELQGLIQRFKEEHIFPNITKGEPQHKRFLGWLQYFEEFLFVHYTFLFREAATE